ncbi:MAG: putative autophagy-related protein 8a isoform X1 [Terrestrivirus sp.]|uniref:Putative autophagy-related protein 8a isoform X1 n=1 Tax=Terrestrivirus sp. TaxID=2487775 RepID=A0A3G4ZN55_9VIRU|nr:MAG: putative autophagy-related protein 8a isoform X1 [Terrestrivirus sp.]
MFSALKKTVNDSLDGSNKSFKDKHSFDERCNESAKILQKYPDRVPVIVEKKGSVSIADIDKHKYLVPNDLTMGKFLYVIRKRLHLSPEKALFIFVKDTLPPTSEMIGTVYQTHKDEDGFLYVCYADENTFGSD